MLKSMKAEMLNFFTLYYTHDTAEWLLDTQNYFISPQICRIFYSRRQIVNKKNDIC